MREIVHIQVGRCGNQIGAKVCICTDLPYLLFRQSKFIYSTSRYMGIAIWFSIGPQHTSENIWLGRAANIRSAVLSSSGVDIIQISCLNDEPQPSM